MDGGLKTDVGNSSGDTWCDLCFEHVKKEDQGTHREVNCRPLLPNIKALEWEGIEVDWGPYADEKIFKVSKAITWHLVTDVKRTNGLFQETTAMDNLKEMWNMADEMIDKKNNVHKHDAMVQWVSEIQHQSKGIHW